MKYLTNYDTDVTLNITWERMDAALVQKVASGTIVSHPTDLTTYWSSPPMTPNAGFYYTGDAFFDRALTVIDAALVGTLPVRPMPMTADADANKNFRAAITVLATLGIAVPVNP